MLLENRDPLLYFMVLKKIDLFDLYNEIKRNNNSSNASEFKDYKLAKKYLHELIQYLDIIGDYNVLIRKLEKIEQKIVQSL